MWEIFGAKERDIVMDWALQSKESDRKQIQRFNDRGLRGRE